MRADRLRRLRRTLDALLEEFPIPERLPTDPVSVLHGFDDPADQEVAGLVAASVALGRAASIRAKARELLDIMGGEPAAFVRRFDPERHGDRFDGWTHRWYRARDIVGLLWLLRQAIERHGSLGACFLAGYREDEPDIGGALGRFVGEITSGDVTAVWPSGHLPERWRSLLATPERRSACKRMNLYLRWMVRPDDGVDLGPWSAVSPSKLVIPLDTHLVRVSRALGLTRRKSPGWPMAVEVTHLLRRLDPDDPVKYDFLLCHLGMLGRCPWSGDLAACPGCSHWGRCIVPGAGRSGSRGRKSMPRAG